jgi:prepilin signal peptidase PulO-like enzyme (type II secretory pathway)
MVLNTVLLAVLGAAMGSFVGALVWRLHTKRDFVKDRSECEHCHHLLGPLDLVPIFSWIALGGRCRYCKKPIGLTAILLELGMALVFALSYWYWPLGFTDTAAQVSFVIWLISMVLLAALFVYDLKWFLLPDKIVFILIGLALLDAIFRSSLSGENYFIYIALGLIPIAGIYGLLYVISGGKWVGFGDVKLGIFMGIMLGWQKALLVLALANLLGFVVVIPGLLSKKLTRTSKVPFGPFLIAAFFIAGLWGDQLINWYMLNLLIAV